MESRFPQFVEALRGKAIFAVPVPYATNGNGIDYQHFLSFVFRLSELGVRAFAIGKSSGLYTLSEQEIGRLGYMMSIAVQGTVLMPIRTSMIGTINSATALDCPVLVMDPSIPCTDEDLIRYYRLIAKKLPRSPMVIYRTGGLPSEGAIRGLIEQGTIAGVKWGPKAGRDEFLWLVGDYPQICWQAACGGSLNRDYAMATAWWTETGNITPRWTLEQVRSIVAGDSDRVAKITELLTPLDSFRIVLNDGLCNIAAIYHALEMLGTPIGRPRPPIHDLDSFQQKVLKGVIDELQAAGPKLEESLGLSW